MRLPAFPCLRAPDPRIARSRWASLLMALVLTAIRFQNLTYYLRIANLHVRSLWLSHWFNGAATRAAATPIVIRRAGEVVRVVAKLPLGGSIRASCRHADGSPVENGPVVVTRADDRRLWTCLQRTGDTGDVWIGPLPDGTYKIGGGDSVERASWYPGTADWDSAAGIAIRDHDDVTGIVWRLLPRR